MQMRFHEILLLLLPLALQLFGVTVAVLIDPYIKKKHKTIMLIIVSLLISLIVQNVAECLFENEVRFRSWRLISSIYGYSVRPAIPVMFCYLIGEERSYRPAWFLVILNAAIHLSALFSGICFGIDANNHFFRGPLGYSCHIVSAVLLAYLVFLSAKEYSRARRWETVLPVSNALMIVISVVLDTFVVKGSYPVGFLTVTAVSSSVFYYVWLHLQFVREHERALMAEQRIQIMMSQIQPHFLYNTLSTIQALCKTDPEQAFETTEKFGTYLRQNIDSLGQPDLIPIRKELDHIRIYAEIEAIRFPYVRVDYDTEDLDFRVPALTIQPLVENAIRHGVRIRKEGIVTVRTRRTKEGHEITVIDNGKGFDAALLSAEDGSHIGLRNVRGRVEQMCGGTLTVDSVIDIGTTVTIRIPDS